MKRQGMAFFFFNFLWLLSFIGFLFTNKASNDLLTPYAFIGFLFTNKASNDLLTPYAYSKSGAKVEVLGPCAWLVHS
jgi:hypothetical protein